MKHLNGNLLCTVDVETTGINERENEIVEVCILPLDKHLEPHPDILMFATELKPDFPERIDPEALRIQRRDTHYDMQNTVRNQQRLYEIFKQGLPQGVGRDLLIDWFENLNLRPKKRIMPIAHNWVFDRGFLREWLGVSTFEYIFDPRYRDTLSISLFANDVADNHGQRCPYAKNNLQYLASQLKIETHKAHTAVEDCYTTAKVFKRMVQESMPHILL